MTEKSAKVKTVIDMIIQKMHHFALFKNGNIYYTYFYWIENVM